MYKNFNLTDEERQQILEQHKSHGYKKPLSEQSFITSPSGQKYEMPDEPMKNDPFVKHGKDDYESSVENDDYDERQERNYGVED